MFARRVGGWQLITSLHTDRLADAEAVNSLFKAELIRNKGPWWGINDLKDRDGRIHRLVQPPQASRQDRSSATHRGSERIPEQHHPVHHTNGTGLTNLPLKPGLDRAHQTDRSGFGSALRTMNCTASFILIGLTCTFGFCDGHTRSTSSTKP